jgi:hypothetical protein
MGLVKYIKDISSNLLLINLFAIEILLQIIVSIDSTSREDKIDFISPELTLGAFSFLIIIPIFSSTNTLFDFLKYIFIP